MRTVNNGQFRASYNYWFADGILFMEDLNIGRSLTNDMENVILDIEREEHKNLIDHPICYRDSEGIWDAIKWDGNAADFIFLGAVDSEEAKELLMEKINKK